jgi:hypothetical protein
LRRCSSARSSSARRTHALATRICTTGSRVRTTRPALFPARVALRMLTTLCFGVCIRTGPTLDATGSHAWRHPQKHPEGAPQFPRLQNGAWQGAPHRRGLRARAAPRAFGPSEAMPRVPPSRMVPSAQVKQVVGQADESKEVHESRLHLVELQQRLRGDFEDLVVPARKLLREASVQEVPTRGSTFARHPSHASRPLTE